ncbi:hypothetical protein D1007_00534 [Hordeum vulgare]|nr:hypothetical protein D1007_00534 [Hordeum vulgare]
MSFTSCPECKEERPVDRLAADRDKAAMELPPPPPLALAELVHSTPLLWCQSLSPITICDTWAVGQQLYASGTDVSSLVHVF